MMPFVAILSTIDTVWLSAALAPSRSLSSREARIAFSEVRSFERICRLCSRRLTFCRFALRADFVRLATVLASSLSREKPGSTKEQFYHYPVSLRLEDVHRDFPLAVPLADPDTDVKPLLRRLLPRPEGVGAPGVTEISRPGSLRIA